MAGWLMLVLAAVGAEPERLVVPLEPASWSNSTPAALRGGRAPAALAEDDGQPALQAPFGFGDPKLNEPLFISTKLPTPPLRRAVRQIRFRYRFDAPGPTAPLLTPGGFRVRLRTGPTSFTDHDVPLVDGGWPTGRWVEAVLEADLFAGRITNIYSRLFDDQHVQELTFRLDDVDHQNAAGTLHLADLALVVEADGSEQPYTPVVSPRPDSARLRLLNIVHGADGWYDFDLAARRLDPGVEVLSSPFRGLHFPIWDFPASRAELLSYDLIVLGDVDPWVLTDTQVRWLVDAVHSGAGLLLGGGHHSLGLAKKHPRALLDLLPVTYQPGAPVVVANAPALAGAGELAAGLPPEALGRVGAVAAVTPRPGAAVALTAGPQPLLVTAQAGRGRVAVLTSWAQPNRVDDRAFMTTAAWEPFAARLAAWLTHRPLPPQAVAPPPPPPWRVQWHSGHATLVPERPFGVMISGAEGEARAVLYREGREVWRGGATARKDATPELSGLLPNLSAGPVELRVSVGGQEAILRGSVVDPLRRRDFFPVISFLPLGEGGHQPDEALALEVVDDLAAHGFNTVAMGYGEPQADRLPTVVRGRAIERATVLGMATIREYSSFTLLHGERPYAVSPYDPAFKAALAEKVAPTVTLARTMPRLLSIKILDEPTIGLSRVDSSETTARVWSPAGGDPLPRQAPADPGTRYDLGRFLSDYLARDFATGQALKTELGIEADLLLTYMNTGYGLASPLTSHQDAWRWTAAADRFDFDVYPYFYPSSQRYRFLLADWCFAASRVISATRNKPWGFYLELDDRNWPYQQNPAEASAETADTAIAAGVDYLNSFIHRNFATGSRARPKRWEKTGVALRRIQRLGPLLTHWRRPGAPAAVLWPEAQQIIRDGTPMPLYGLALLRAAAGSADVVHEELLAKGLPNGLDLLLLSGVDILHREAAAGLLAWVAAGGTVVADRLPAVDERGEPLTWPASFANTGQHNHGRGRLLRLADNLEERCRLAVESSDAAWEALLTELHGQLRPALRRATVELLENRLQGEVAVRRDADSGLVMLLNHDGAPRRTVARVGGWGFVPAWVVDLGSGATVACQPAADGSLELAAELPARQAVYLGVYPAQPRALTVTTPSAPLSPGERLRYRLAIEPASGCHLVELRVVAPDGRVHARLGGARATTAGLLEVDEKLPDDIPVGNWRIEAALPLAGLTATASVRVVAP